MTSDRRDVPDFPAWKWRYIERMFAAHGQPVARRFVRELRDRATWHELALREIEDTEWGNAAHRVNGPNDLAHAALCEEKPRSTDTDAGCDVAPIKDWGHRG